MNFIKAISSYFGEYGSIAVIVILLLILISIKFNANIRKLAYTLIPEAEDGSIQRHFQEGVLKYIERLQNSDLDERMVEVIAVLLQQIPILRIIPFTTATKYLNSLVQKTFNNVKKSLNTSIYNIPRNTRIQPSDLDEFLGETIESTNDKVFAEYEKNFAKLEEEVNKLKGMDSVDNGALNELEKVVSLFAPLNIPTLNK